MSRPTLFRIYGGAFILGFWFSFVGLAWGHVFPDHQSPGAGSVLSASPQIVQIWFDGVIEPIFSTIKVEDAEGHEIAKGAVAPGQSDPTQLQASLPTLSPGIYQVKWSIVARDGHRTEGQYIFIIKSSP
jgi:copper resistance protein C